MEGQCLCGAMKFSCKGETLGVAVCHCKQCREWTSSRFMAAYYPEGVEFESDATLKWYQSSDFAERGFCSNCGSTLFFRRIGDKTGMNVAAGSMEEANHEIVAHAWADAKPDWYGFTDMTPRLEASEFRIARDRGEV